MEFYERPFGHLERIRVLTLHYTTLWSDSESYRDNYLTDRLGTFIEETSVDYLSLTGLQDSRRLVPRSHV